MSFDATTLWRVPKDASLNVDFDTPIVYVRAASRVIFMSKTVE